MDIWADARSGGADSPVYRHGEDGEVMVVRAKSGREAETEGERLGEAPTGYSPPSTAIGYHIVFGFLGALMISFPLFFFRFRYGYWD